MLCTYFRFCLTNIFMLLFRYPTISQLSYISLHSIAEMDRQTERWA